MSKPSKVPGGGSVAAAAGASPVQSNVSPSASSSSQPACPPGSWLIENPRPASASPARPAIAAASGR
ncbi:MAG: hypothetical protein H6916_09315 [Novosphingobium sp.]|uniref:hypothetical protein n=1 Tax=Novosphingobium sp. TaxID=1874826 RepID=UPI0026353953|nr:hypothetical protein [Novosphingobium sp.]MCP5386991.1 hypothetical protein [Novosphingobium sp.]